MRQRWWRRGLVPRIRIDHERGSTTNKLAYRAVAGSRTTGVVMGSYAYAFDCR
jgi:hypothetical protein